MTERIKRGSVEFARPFKLCGVDGLQPAGIYEVETVEEQIDNLSSIAYRRISTSIMLSGQNAASFSRQQTLIDPADLATALTKDAEVHHGHA
jgi:hypothetical protein